MPHALKDPVPSSHVAGSHDRPPPTLPLAATATAVPVLHVAACPVAISAGTTDGP